VTTHPVGFRKRYLLRTPWLSIRLHRWTGAGSEDPHDHRWTFISIPIRGTLHDTRWTAQPGTTWTRQRTTPDRGHGRTYTPDGTDRLIPLATYPRLPWRPYRCPYDEIHSFTASAGALTLVVMGPARRDHSHVWSRP
jgi:hypothetical protein